jgi:hypothetical protein
MPPRMRCLLLLVTKDSARPAIDEMQSPTGEARHCLIGLAHAILWRIVSKPTLHVYPCIWTAVENCAHLEKMMGAEIGSFDTDQPCCTRSP